LEPRGGLIRSLVMPPRDVSKSRTRKALRRLKRVAESAAAPDGVKLSDWEKEFVSGVSGRLEKYGSAFRDPAKGRLEEALSQRQTNIARVLHAKTRKKAAGPESGEGKDRPPPRSTLKRSAMQRKAPMRSRRPPRTHDIAADDPEEEG
jgi:hypothetical protein